VSFIRIRGITARKAVQHLLVPTEQFTQSAGLPILGCDDEFFIATLPGATFYDLKQIFRAQIARELLIQRAFQLHCILHTCPESALS
jgi:hypothetical protein